MTGGGPDDRWEDWLPDLGQDDPDSERFKWGWNEVDGEIVWPVGGPGEGWPAHFEQLGVAWGMTGPRAGDVIGAADFVPARESEPAVVVIHAYFGGRVPESSSIGSVRLFLTLKCVSLAPTEDRGLPCLVG